MGPAAVDATRSGHRDARAAIAAGAALLAQLALTGAVVAADEDSAYAFGHRLTLGCAFRSRFGVPCPACGATRGVALALRGHLVRAWAVFPAAPLGVVGLLLLAVALLAWGLRASHGGASASTPSARPLRIIALGYGGFTLALWLGAWALRLGGVFALPP